MTPWFRCFSYTTSDSSLSSRVFEFEKGANQSFGTHGKFHLIKPSNFKETEVQMVFMKSIYSLEEIRRQIALSHWNNRCVEILFFFVNFILVDLLRNYKSYSSCY